MTMCWERVLLNKCGCIITETESLSYRTAEVRPPECALSLMGNYFMHGLLNAYIAIICTVKPVLSGHLWDKDKVSL